MVQRHGVPATRRELERGHEHERHGGGRRAVERCGAGNGRHDCDAAGAARVCGGAECERERGGGHVGWDWCLYGDATGILKC